MSLTFDILNTLVKAQERSVVINAVKAWLAIQEGADFLEANPGLSFGNEGNVSVQQKEVDGLALLVEAIALSALKDAEAEKDT